MPEPTSRGEQAPGPESAAASSAPLKTGEGRVLLVMIVASGAIMDDLVTGLLDVGVAGTVIESKGLMALLREEMPIFGGLASMLPATTGSRVVLSVTQEGLAESVFTMLTEEFKQADRPIAFTVPIDRIVGMRQ